MIRLAANCSWLFTELPFLERFDAAAAAGFPAVECMFPYEVEATTLARAVAAAGVPLVLMNAPAGDWAAGDRGLAALPPRVEEFRADVRVAADYAHATHARFVHVMAGVGGDWSCYVDNLAWAAELLAQVGAVVTVEPLNPIDVPGYLVSSSEAARRACDGAGPRVRMQADLYHLRRLGEDAGAVVTDELARIAHVQIASVPARAEPDGDDDRALLALLDPLGYDGWVGCEYAPAAGTVAGLGWAEQYGVQPRVR